MMKKAMMAIAAALMMSATMVAQTEEQPQAPQPPTMDKAEMVKARTEQMVKDYGLSEEQAGQLLALNTEFADKLPPMMGAGRRGFMRPQGGEGRPQAGQGRGERRRGNGEARPERGERRLQPDSVRRLHRMGEGQPFDREAMMKAMEEYNAGIEKIFTEDQLKKYKEDMQRRRPQGPRGRRGERPVQRQEQQ